MQKNIDYETWVFRFFPDETEREKLLFALAFARKKHSGQRRRKSGEPFIRHPEMVSMIVHLVGMPLDYVVAALLHDVTEDCRVSKSEVEEIFGKRIGDLVHFMDKKSFGHFEEDLPCFISYEEKFSYFVHNVDKEAILLRLADSWSNLWEYQGYKNEERANFAVQEVLKTAAKAREILPQTKNFSDFLVAIERLARRIGELVEI